MSSSSGSDGEIVVPVKRVKRHHHPVASGDAVKLQRINLYSHKILPKLDALAKSPVKAEDDHEDEGNDSVSFGIDNKKEKKSSPKKNAMPKKDAASPKDSQSKSESEGSPCAVVTPTPPPPFQPRRGRRRNKASKILKEVTSVLSQVGRDDGAQNDSIQSIDEDFEVVKEIMVKIRFRGKLNRFPHVESEPFAEVFEKLAKKAKVQPTRLLITFGDKRVFPSDTPADIQMSIADILNCVVAHQRLAPDVKDTIRIKMQGPYQKKKVLFTMGKSESFLGVMQEYAEKSKVDIKDLEFQFDGEFVDPTSTPKSLDMDNDDCLDVMPLKKT